MKKFFFISIKKNKKNGIFGEKNFYFHLNKKLKKMFF